MLVLSRKPGQLIHIGNNVEVTVLAVRGQRVLVGLNAPAEVPIRRQEVSERIARQDEDAAFRAGLLDKSRLHGRRPVCDVSDR